MVEFFPVFNMEILVVSMSLFPVGKLCEGKSYLSKSHPWKRNKKKQKGMFFGGRFSDCLQRVATLYNLFVACNSFHMFPISKQKKSYPLKKPFWKQPKHLQDSGFLLVFSPWWNLLGYWRLVWSLQVLHQPPQWLLLLLDQVGGCHEVGVNISVLVGRIII